MCTALWREPLVAVVAADHPIATESLVQLGELAELHLILIANAHCPREVAIWWRTDETGSPATAAIQVPGGPVDTGGSGSRDPSRTGDVTVAIGLEGGPWS